KLISPDVACAQLDLVAQICNCNLLYRRLVIGRTSENSSALAAAKAPQNAILRYSRLQICATPNTYSSFTFTDLRLTSLSMSERISSRCTNLGNLASERSKLGDQTTSETKAPCNAGRGEW